MSGIIAQNVLDNSGLIKAPEGGGAWNFIKKLTASADSTLSFVNGASDVDLATYKAYLFTFNQLHPADDNVKFTFNLSTDAGSNYNVAKQSTYAQSYHNEAGSTQANQYDNSADSTLSTSATNLTNGCGNDADQTISGYLRIFDMSSSTYQKHFMSQCNTAYHGDFSFFNFIGGYANTTSDVDAVQFAFSAGEIDSGDICLYGLSTSA